MMQVRALYDYEASLDDPNQLSFKNGDIFDVIDGCAGKLKQRVGRLGSYPPTSYTAIP